MATRVLLDVQAAKEGVEEGRLGQILGKDFLVRSVPIEHHAGPVEIAGWVGLPTASRGQPDQQYWFVNGRAVRDKLLMNAVRVAYRDVLYGGRHPAYVLYLTIDPKLVDVNAHPQKLEVRFRDSRQIHEFVFRAIERVLANTRPDSRSGARGRGGILNRHGDSAPTSRHCRSINPRAIPGPLKRLSRDLSRRCRKSPAPATTRPAGRKSGASQAVRASSRSELRWPNFMGSTFCRKPLMGWF